MISHLRRTKIIATFGPSITKDLFSFKILEDPNNQLKVQEVYETTKESLLAGVNVVRLNFSHGSREEQLVRAHLVRKAAAELQRPVSIMLDTKGPEIRVCDIGKSDGRMFLKNQKITIYTLTKQPGTDKSFSVTDSTGTYNMAKDVKVGDVILVDDGKLVLHTNEVDRDRGIIECLVKNDHLLKTNKRINLPASDYSIPFLSQKDHEDILFAIENKFNYIAASFVNNKQNVLDIKAILKSANAEHIKVIAKIESRQAINNLDEILTVVDGIMIARGDLGLEVPYYEVPYWGKYIVKKCRYANIPVIMATQMLDSLEKNIIPTRAEASDVFWAVERGVDATMLSGESAQGQFPINAINVMSKLARQSEIFFDYKRSLSIYYPQIPHYSSAQGQMIEKIAEKLFPKSQGMDTQFSYQSIAVFTNDYEFLKMLSISRPAARVLAFTTDVTLYNSCGILYAITPILVKDLDHAITNHRAYVKHYYDNHIQCKNPIVSRKTLFLIGDKLLEALCDDENNPDPIKVEFLHQNY